MKIDFNYEKTTRLSNIKTGDVFIYKGGLFIKIFDSNKAINAVNLDDGSSFSFSDIVQVERINAKLVLDE